MTMHSRPCKQTLKISCKHPSETHCSHTDKKIMKVEGMLDGKRVVKSRFEKGTREGKEVRVKRIEIYYICI